MSYLLSAKDIRNTTLSNLDGAVSKWWKANLDGINKQLLEAARLGFNETTIEVPTPYKIPIIGRFVDQGYKANCTYDVGNGNSTIVVLW